MAVIKLLLSFLLKTDICTRLTGIFNPFIYTDNTNSISIYENITLLKEFYYLIYFVLKLLSPKELLHVPMKIMTIQYVYI